MHISLPQYTLSSVLVWWLTFDQAGLSSWSKSFLEAGKNGLTKAILRDATSEEVRGLKLENSDLKKAVAELVLEVQRYKKSLGM